MVSLNELIWHLGNIFNVTADIERLSEQPGDVDKTWADISCASDLLGCSPQTTLKSGLLQFSK